MSAFSGCSDVEKVAGDRAGLCEPQIEQLENELLEKERQQQEKAKKQREEMEKEITNVIKAVDTIRVDGASDEGPTQNEVQFCS